MHASIISTLGPLLGRLLLLLLLGGSGCALSRLIIGRSAGIVARNA